MPDVNMFRKIVEQQKNLHFRHKNISMLNLFFIWPLKDMLFAKRYINVTKIYPRFSTETYTISKQSIQNSRNLLVR